jgi:hypothetical protein
MSYLPTRDNFDALYHRLGFNYGYEYAVNVTRGKDPATEADIAAWKALGNKGGTLARRMVRR